MVWCRIRHESWPHLCVARCCPRFQAETWRRMQSRHIKPEALQNRNGNCLFTRMHLCRTSLSARPHRKVVACPGLTGVPFPGGPYIQDVCFSVKLLSSLCCPKHESEPVNSKVRKVQDRVDWRFSGFRLWKGGCTGLVTTREAKG